MHMEIILSIIHDQPFAFQRESLFLSVFAVRIGTVLQNWLPLILKNEIVHTDSASGNFCLQVAHRLYLGGLGWWQQLGMLLWIMSFWGHQDYSLRSWGTFPGSRKLQLSFRRAYCFPSRFKCWVKNLCYSLHTTSLPNSSIVFIIQWGFCPSFYCLL